MRFILSLLACLAVAFANPDRAAADPRMTDIVQAGKLRIGGWAESRNERDTRRGSFRPTAGPS